MHLMWRHLEVSYTFLSRGEGNARLQVADIQRRENQRKSPKIRKTLCAPFAPVYTNIKNGLVHKFVTIPPKLMYTNVKT